MYDFVEQHDGYTISRKFFRNSDPRCGRHVCHDSRSLNYQVEARDISTLKSIRHKRNIPILNQGNRGSCTGNAGTGNLASSVFWDEGQHVLSPTDANADEGFAVTVYSDATKLDSYQGTYPPLDTGSDGLSVAKVLKNRKLIGGYQHATSFEAFLTALADQPVIAGVEWFEDMFNPDADGRVHITGASAGGHEIVFTELDVENQRAWFDNSWTSEWGVEGRGYFTWDDLKALLAQQGDVTVFVAVSAPAPTPTPPAPTPTPTPVPTNPIFQEVIDAAKEFVKTLEKLVGVTDA